MNKENKDRHDQKKRQGGEGPDKGVEEGKEIKKRTRKCWERERVGKT